MSKTSSRQARKRKLEMQRQVLASRSVVGWEEHHRVVVELERVSAVLADLIEEQKGAAVPAREVVAWVKNPAAVHHLLASSGIQGIGTEDDTCCAGCGCDIDRPHDRNCTVFDARWRLGMAAGLADFETAREAAQAEDRARSHRKYDVTYRPSIQMVASEFVPPGVAYLMNPADFMPPPTIKSRMEQARQVADLADLFPADYLRFISSPDLGETTPFRREYLGEFPLVAHGATNPGGPDYERWVSDNRGIEVVEAEARAHHAGLMLSARVFPF